MAEYKIQDTTLDAIADAINAKTGGSSAMTPAQMVTEIAAIPSGGGSIGEYTLLGEYEISEPVSAINFSATEQVKNCQSFVFILSNVITDANDYIRLNVNGASQSYRNSRASTYDDFKIFACIAGDKSQMFTPVFFWDLSLSADVFAISPDWSFFQLRFLQNAKFTSGKVQFYGR